jgi:hypothetical protein
MLGFVLGSAGDVEAQKSKSKRKAAAKKTQKERPPPPDPDDEGPGAPASSSGGAAGDDSRALKRGERIEFDARLIQGQTAKAGAVYLFERASSNLRSMVKDRVSFREKIVRTVFPAGKDPPKEEKKEMKEKKEKAGP